MNKWSRPFEGSSAPAAPAGSSFASVEHHYFAFLSYSHEDAAMADWLHGELERFRVPASLAGRLTGNGVVPERLSPIFRDRHELAAGHDLTAEIRQALAGSRCLIVLCSPAAARSKWTNAEIEEFKRAHPEGCVIAAIAAGEPFASEGGGDPKDECFPAALRQKYDRRGRSTGRRAEPLAADLRESGDGKRLGPLKIVAGILGLGLDDLVQRDHLRRQRRLAAITAGSLGGMLVASFLAVTAINARDEARDQRREAESLVEFMVGDLSNKLQPIGRLDVLDGVGSRVLQYYGQQDTAQLSDQGLAQRSKALTMMGQIARDRGDLDRADALYRAAYAGTQEAIRRQPEDPERLFEHAQNAFYIGEIADKRGRLDAAEAAFREYKVLADRMVAIAPDDMRWRMEVQYAAVNLGLTLYSRRNFRDATQQFVNALSTIRAFAAADPDNGDFQLGVADALAQLADAQTADGELPAAVETRRQHVALLESLLPKQGATARSRLVPGYRELGRLLAAQGHGDVALSRFQAAVREGERLSALEPANTRWHESLLAARLELARALLDRGDAAGSAGSLGPDCAAYRDFLAQEPDVAMRRVALRECLLLESQAAARSGRGGEAVRAAERGVEIARSVRTTDPVDARFGLVKALRILGDARRGAGDLAGARSAWANARSAIPAGVLEKPDEMREHSLVLARVGNSAEAAAIGRRLAKMGYA